MFALLGDSYAPAALRSPRLSALLPAPSPRFRDYLITDDANTMWRYCDELRQAGHLNFRPIKLQDGFSLQPFSPDGQTDLSSLIEEEAAQYGSDEE